MNAKNPALLICALLLLHTACTQAEKSEPKTAGAASEASAPQSGTQSGSPDEWDGDDPDDRPDERTAAIQERCRNKLRRPDTVDDLTVQLYRTGVKDDCLYHMGKKELRKIWEIPVTLTYRGVDRDDPRLKKKVENAYLGIYILKRVKKNSETGEEYYREYTVHLNSAGLENPGSLFPSGQPPANMPVPLELREPSDPGFSNLPPPHYVKPPEKSSYHPLQTATLKSGFDYVWVSKPRRILISVGNIAGLNDGAVTEISVMNDGERFIMDDELLVHWLATKQSKKTGAAK